MNIEEAYKILKVNQDISDDDLKKEYKALAKQWHPDINKEVEAENKFKQINEAYQLICDVRQNPEKYQSQQNTWGNVEFNFSDFFNLQDLFGSGKKSKYLNNKPIQVTVDISFIEAVKGCTKQIVYTRNIKCATCDGEGEKHFKNDCKICNGFGQTTNRQGNMIFQSACKCQGKGVKHEECTQCKGSMIAQQERQGEIQIPQGIQNNSILRMPNEGNYIGKNHFSEMYSEVHVNIKVEKHPSMSMDGINVRSSSNLSLLEALQGKTINIDTVYGSKEVIVPPKSKHNETISIKDCGVSGTPGCHILTLNVEYPNNIDKLIEVLDVSNTM